ncbi:FG-GAP repeat domain-containing protein, partial [Actinophytocola xanthii]
MTTLNRALAVLAALTLSAAGLSVAQASVPGARGDFNGDGFHDVAGLYDYGNARTGLWTWTAKTTGGFTAPTMVWDSGPGAWDQTRSKPVAGDFTGDRRTDLAVFYDYGNARTALWTWTAKTTGGFTAPTMAWDSGVGAWDQTRSKPVAGDFTGDRRTDLAVFYDYGNARTALWTWTAKTTGGFTAPTMAWDSGVGAWDQTRSKPVAGDFTGDRRTDLAVFYDYGNARTALWTWTAKTTGGFTAPTMAWDSGVGAWDQTRSKPVAGDFTGDRRTDLAVFYDYGNARTALWTWTAKTTGGFTAPTMAWDSGVGAWDQTRSKPVAGDFTGDRRTDLAVFYDYGNARTALWTWTARTTGGFTAPTMAWDSGVGAWDQTRSKPVAGDFTGDGRADLGVFYDYGNA